MMSHSRNETALGLLLLTNFIPFSSKRDMNDAIEQLIYKVRQRAAVPTPIPISSDGGSQLCCVQAECAEGN